jgi:hypothetical protein
MSTYKNTSGNYTITVTNGTGIFTVNAANIKLNGQVTQIGNTTTVFDFITVAANNTGAITDMGLLAQTTANTFAGLRFDTIANTWQISSSVLANGAPVAAYANLAVSGSANSTVAGSNTQIQFNSANAFGASANLVFDYVNNVLKVQGFEVLGNIATTPAIAPSNGVALYNKAIGGGGTGLYVLSSSVSDELVSKSKAIVYGIIF